MQEAGMTVLPWMHLARQWFVTAHVWLYVYDCSIKVILYFEARDL